MKNKGFISLVALSSAAGISLVLSWLFSTDAVLNRFIDWLHKCCGWNFKGPIPIAYFIISLLVLSVLFLFVIQIYRVIRKTNKKVSSLFFNKVTDMHPTIRSFSEKQNVFIQMIENDLPFVFSYGLVQPKILVSTTLVSLLDEPELCAVLQHEYHHCIKRDPLKMLLAFSFTRSLFFLPVLKHFQSLYFIEKEIEADQYAATQVGRKHVAAALYKMLQCQQQRFPSPLTVGFTHVNTGDLRIEALVNGVKKTPRIKKMDWVISLVNLSLILLLIYVLFSQMSFVAYMNM